MKIKYTDYLYEAGKPVTGTPTTGAPTTGAPTPTTGSPTPTTAATKKTKKTPVPATPAKIDDAKFNALSNEIKNFWSQITKK
jgi:hypothetical protein